MLVHFEISSAHIALGSRGIACSCPAAIALANVLGAQVSVRMWPEYADIDGKPHPLGADLRAWIRDYDDGKPVEPAVFAVDTDVTFDKANRFADVFAGSCFQRAA